MTSTKLKHAASAAIFDHGQVLLIQRGAGVNQGLWSLPGGHIREGETAQETALREVLEETGIQAEIKEQIGHIGVKSETGNRYQVTVFYGQRISGDIQAGSDAIDARWVPFEDIPAFNTTSGLNDILRKAHSLFCSE